MDFKNYYHVLASALLILSFGACGKQSEQDGGSGGFPADRLIRVSAEVTPATKGTYSTETLKEFDLFIKSGNSKYSYTNTKFTKNEAGEWEPVRQMLWAGKNVGFEYLAVAPPLQTGGHSLSDNPICEFTVESEQTKGSCASDLLWAGFKNLTPEENLTQDGKMKIEFTHALTLLKVRLTLSTEFNHGGVPTDNPIKDVVIGGFDRKVKLTPSDDNLPKLNAAGDAGSISAYELEWKRAVDEAGNDDRTKNCVVTYECIVVPKMMSAFTVDFICNGKPYTYKATGSFPFMCGNSYLLPLTVGKDEVILSGEIAATPWEAGNGEGENIETD